MITAQVDYNADTSSYLEINLLKNAKTSLNLVLARDLNTDFQVDEAIDINSGLDYATLAGQMEQMNPDLQNAFINKNSRVEPKANKRSALPVIGVNGGYEYQKSSSPTGFNTQQRANGFTYGITASLNIFNGFLQRQNERNARIGINSSELTLEKTKQDIGAQLIWRTQNYKTSLELLKVERNNVEIAKENLDITLAKYSWEA